MSKELWIAAHFCEVLMIPVDLLMAFNEGKIIRASEWGLTQAQLDIMLSDITEDEWNVWEDEDEKEEQAKAA